MQLLCPVTEGAQLPQTQRISSVWPLQRGCMAPSELLLPSRCTLLRRNWILVHSKLPAVVWNSKPHCSLGSPQNLLAWRMVRSYTSETRDRDQLRNCRRDCSSKQGFVWCPNCHEKSHIWKIQCKTNSWETSINGQTVSNMVPKSNRNVQTVNLKAVLIHAMNTVSSEPALTTHQVFQASSWDTTKTYRGQVFLKPTALPNQKPMSELQQDTKTPGPQKVLCCEW